MKVKKKRRDELITLNTFIRLNVKDDIYKLYQIDREKKDLCIVLNHCQRWGRREWREWGKGSRGKWDRWRRKGRERDKDVFTMNGTKVEHEIRRQRNTKEKRTSMGKREKKRKIIIERMILIIIMLSAFGANPIIEQILYVKLHHVLFVSSTSLGVSIKMNLLLFAPALLFLLLATHGIKGTIKNLIICAVPQVLLNIVQLKLNNKLIENLCPLFDFSEALFLMTRKNPGQVTRQGPLLSSC